VRRLRRANNAASPSASIRVSGASKLYERAIVELDNGGSKERGVVARIDGDVVTLSDALTGQYYEGQRAWLIEAEVSVRYGEQSELFTAPLANRNKDAKHGEELAKYINDRSTLIRVSVPEDGGFSDTDLASFPTTLSGGWQRLENGNNGIEGLTPADFVGIDGGSGKRTGIQSLEDIEEISICMVPGIWAPSVQSALIQHCESLRYRFAVLDPKDGLDIEGIRTFRAPLDSKYAALYYPWLVLPDPRVDATVPAEKAKVHVAPSGHIAGIYARVDVERGVHKAPGNEVIRGIFPGPRGLADDVTKREQDMLNPNGINALRFFPDRGDRVWGARTISSDSAWKYINVRRLFIYVEASIDRGTQWVVFEPNDTPLWARVRQSISNFLTSVWRSGALQGTTADEAFFVKIDRSTMTQDDIDNGRLICLIGIAPVKPAEFVIFRIQQKTLEIKLS
jgi:hypothetical protein